MSQNAFEFFLGRKNARVVRLLETNPDVSGTIQALLEHLVEYCAEEGIEFSQLRLIDPHMSPDGQYLKAQIVKSY